MNDLFCTLLRPSELELTLNADAVSAFNFDFASYLSPMEAETELGIKRVIYNDPCTIVFWNDDTKTVVKCQNENFDKEKGLAMAIIKKAMGNDGSYYEIFKEWVDEE